MSPATRRARLPLFAAALLAAAASDAAGQQGSQLEFEAGLARGVHVLRAGLRILKIPAVYGRSIAPAYIYSRPWATPRFEGFFDAWGGYTQNSGPARVSCAARETVPRQGHRYVALDTPTLAGVYMDAPPASQQARDGESSR
jgi:hypothetical protein